MGHLAGNKACLDLQQRLDRIPVGTAMANRQLTSRFVALMTAGFLKRVSTNPVLESEA
ncbi:MAG: hypothetical protein PVG53_08965 [Holophagae bacterium]|jgi:hypothetical protein